MVSIKDPPPSLSAFLYYATSCSLGYNKVRRVPTPLPLIVSLWVYLLMFSHSLVHRLAYSAILRVYSLERFLEPSPRCHSLTTITLSILDYFADLLFVFNILNIFVSILIRYSIYYLFLESRNACPACGVRLADG